MLKLQTTLEKIKKLQIQGANAIAMASLSLLEHENMETFENMGVKSLSIRYIKKMKQTVKLLLQTRPTEPLNQNLLSFINYQLKLGKQLPLPELKTKIGEAIVYLKNLAENNQNRVISYGQSLIKNQNNIFTHCHSSSVEKILVKAKKSGKKFQVFNTETRPLFQGRKTAKNLLQEKIKVTMVADSAAGFLISDASGKDLMMDLVILGADAVLPNGSVINKIGSYGIASSAYLNKIPLYIACNLLKYDVDGIITIEIRAEEEIWPRKPKGLKIINFAFDKIPAKYIKGIITEFGIIKPVQVKATVKKHYPWLTTNYFELRN